MTDDAFDSAEEAMNLSGLAGADGLTASEVDTLRELISVWDSHRQKNLLRDMYYDGKNKLKDLGISIPPSLKDVETVVGWSAKAVDALAVRSMFDGYMSEEHGDYLRRVVDDNRLKILYGQAVTSELKHSCAFLTISKGAEGEPPVIVSAYSATNAAAIWNRRKKRIEAGMAIVDLAPDATSKRTIPTWVNLYTDKETIELKKDGSQWYVRRHEHLMGRPMMEPICYRPSLDRPFGKSRISRAVRSINDSAVRTALRSEVTSEFFTAPQKYLLGADDSTFEEKSAWEAYIGNIFAVTENENGDLPHFGQLPQASMQPHTDYMRSLAARFAGETNIPISELGVIHDNPSSAQAIEAAKEPLIIEAQAINDYNADALRVIAHMAIAIKKNVALSDLSDSDCDVRAVFKNPAMPSVVTMADAMVKAVSPAGAQWVAGTDIYWQWLGMDEATQKQLAAQYEKVQAQQLAMAYATRAQSLSQGQ